MVCTCLVLISVIVDSRSVIAAEDVVINMQTAPTASEAQDNESA